jgi:hypothetical protein
MAIPDDNGLCSFLDTGRRVCIGTVTLKGRRFGDTYKSECVGLEMITRAEVHNSIFGIQSMDAKTGKQDFDKVVHAWKKLPFFFQPKYDNSTNPKEEISFYEPAYRGGNNNTNIDSGLEAVINFASTADRGFYDSTKMLFYLSDEDGKCFGLGTKIRMYDGAIKTVEEIVSGDKLMGDDSTPRNVINTHYGFGKMFRIIPNKGNSWTCNEKHILTLSVTDSFKFKGISYKVNDMLNISVSEYLELPYFKKKSLALYRKEGEYKKWYYFKIEPIGLDDYYGIETDGNKLFLLNDGTIVHNCSGEDVLVRHQVTSQCLSQGQGRLIHGFTIHPTTVGEMADKAVLRFRELCDQSNYYQRNENGQTSSGLYLIFFPSYDGLEGFIDEYGIPVIETPTPQQAEYINSEIGAKEYLQNSLSALLKKGDEISLRSYRELKRLFPLEYADCFLTETGDIGMPYEKIDARLSELSFGKKMTRKGNFQRIGGDKDGFVEWVDDEENGRWEVSRLLPENESNQRYYTNGQWHPSSPDRFLSSQDPFRLSNTQHSKRSDGGGATFMLRDKSIDPDTKDMSEWVTHDFVSTYLYRPETTDEYAEDMLTECVYWGSLAYPEVNLPLIIEHFTKRKHLGYLKFGIDKATGKFRRTAGFSSLGDSKADLFNAVTDYLQKHCHRLKHKDLLLQCKRIKGLDDMKNNDLFTAAGGCLLGAQQVSYRDSVREVKVEAVSIYDYFPSKMVR